MENPCSLINNNLTFIKMKKLSKINLHNLSQAELSRREENLLRGGNEPEIDYGTLSCACVHACTCLYAGKQEGPEDSYYGGSSKEVSGYANQGDHRAAGEESYE